MYREMKTLVSSAKAPAIFGLILGVVMALGALAVEITIHVLGVDLVAAGVGGVLALVAALAYERRTRTSTEDAIAATRPGGISLT